MRSTLNSLRVRILHLPSENALLLVLAVVLGILSSVGVTLFEAAIDFFTTLYRTNGLQLLGGVLGALAIVPIIGLSGLIVGLVMERLIGQIKVIAAAFSLGAGASAGPEDPSVQVGSNLGSMLGQWLHFSDERTRLLVAAGAASGIAVAFRAPISGVFFALEAILGDFSTSAFGVVVLAAVVASASAQAINLSGPELGIRAYDFRGWQELPLYGLLGVLMAFVSAGFIRAFYWQQDFWHTIRLSRPVKTGLAGVIVGLIAVFFPQVMGVGRETLNALFSVNSVQFTLGFLLLLGLAKLLATSVSLGGGFVGGMFAPSLLVGAAFGSAFGQMVHLLLPSFPMGDPAAYAMAGMAAVVAGVIRAPITAVLLLFELTDDYRLIVPLLIVTGCCLLLITRLAPNGIYQEALARKGIRLSAGREINLMQTVTVRQVMQTDPLSVAEDTPAAQLTMIMTRHNTHGVLVTDQAGRLAGIVTLQDIARAQENGQLDKATTADICTRQVVTVTPDTAMADALKVMGARDLGRIPVVAADDPTRAVGLLRRRDVLRAYDLAFTKRQEERDRLRLLIEAG